MADEWIRIASEELRAAINPFGAELSSLTDGDGRELMTDADPAFWMLRLDVLRLINQPVAFDEVAIDYCVTYERSPPSWEPSACLVKLQDGTVSAHASHLSHIGEVTTTFVESQVHQAVVENAAAEQAARMIAMKNATDNAKQLIKDLTLDYNKMRQANITKELLEITTAQMALG